MTNDDHRHYLRLHAAFTAGDVDRLRAELGDPDGFPNVIAHPAMGHCLTYAIYHSPVAGIRALVAQGADPNLDPHDGFPPLIAAISCLQAEPGAAARPDAHAIVELLVASGADVGQRGINDYTALHYAAALGDVRLVEMLLAAGADPNAITRIDDLSTPLEEAERAGHAAVVERLRPLTGRIDWERASEAGDVRTLERMLRSGHDLEACDGLGRTALMRAAYAGRADAVAWLLEHGADRDRTSKHGLSALMLAIMGGQPQIARALVKAGADVAIRGSGAPAIEGKSAADLAAERGDRRLADFLRSKGG